MAFLTGYLRSLVSLILGIAIFFAFFAFLLVNNFSDKLLDADIYIETIAEEDTYNRIYDEILLDEELLADTTQDLLGRIEVIDQKDIVKLLREIIPPEYLQEQVEGTIQRSLEFLNEEVDTLELYIDMGPPLANVKPILFQYIDQRIDELQTQMPDPSKSPTNQVIEVSDLISTLFRELAQGRVPQSIPSVQTIPQPIRGITFDVFFGVLTNDILLDERIRLGLLNSAPEIREEFVAGKIHEVLKLAARPMASPLMNDAIAKVSNELDDQNRLDLIYRLAIWNDSFSEVELRDNITDIRRWINRTRNLGNTVSLAILIGGSLLMGFMHFPNLSGALRWPGLTFLLTGTVFYIAARIAQSNLPDRLDDLIERGTQDISDIPAAVSNLGGDILRSFAEKLVSGIDEPALILIIIGATLCISSFFVFLVRPYIPFQR
jgi:hypothetical protein